MASPWTDERVAEALRLWKNGLSGTQIAGKIGGVSRNAVLGILHRRGVLSKRNQGDEQRIVNRIRHNAWARKEEKAKHRLGATRDSRATPKPSPVRELLKSLPTEPLPPTDTMPATVSHNDLEPHHCRAITAEHLPFDATRKIYCGERKVLGTSYCETHASRYFDAAKVERLNREYQARQAVQHIGRGTARFVGSSREKAHI